MFRLDKSKAYKKLYDRGKISEREYKALKQRALTLEKKKLDDEITDIVTETMKIDDEECLEKDDEDNLDLEESRVIYSKEKVKELARLEALREYNSREKEYTDPEMGEVDKTVKGRILTALGVLKLMFLWSSTAFFGLLSLSLFTGVFNGKSTFIESLFALPVSLMLTVIFCPWIRVWLMTSAIGEKYQRHKVKIITLLIFALLSAIAIGS